MSKVNIEHLLPGVTKPARYTGGEINSVVKDISPAGVRIALAFPDVYEVGMSHLGLKILYEILNDLPDVAAERVYAPWLDMEELLRREGIPLFSLESKMPLAEFDLIGFSLQYELSYTNVLNMLQLSNIPLLSKDRGGEHPLIIAGGPCALNPEPLADFIDLFCIGEAEELIVELASFVKEHRDHKSREEMLSALAQIPGVYVPSLYEVKYHPDGTIESFEPKAKDVPTEVKRRVVDLECVPASLKPIVPFIEIAHDRAGLEIQRGCGRGCRFCQAGFIYRPLRSRSLNTLLRQSQEIIKETGYEEISLGSLSSTDYPDILDLTRGIERCFGRKLAISLPSLRLNSLVTEVSAILSRIKKTGLTIAPEAGTKRLSCVINKDVLDYDLPAIIRDAYQQGWRTVKLYFMIGLPTETWDDIDGIISLIMTSSKRGKKQLKVSLSSFVPKPHTPFQWEAQDAVEQLREKQDAVKRQLASYRGVNIGWNNPETSMLEAVFARGDRRLGQVLLYAFEDGCKFDAWSECLKFSVWMDAFARAGISPEFYAARKRDFGEHLPWDHINTGVNKEYLIKEAARAYEGITTPACQTDKCRQCGICEAETAGDTVKQTPSTYYLPPLAIHSEGRQIRVRLKYTRGKGAAFVSHLDMLRMFMRSLSRAGIPIAYSSGFSPHPRLSFGHPLSVGMMSEEEFLDVELEMPMKLDELINKLNKALPSGIRVANAVFIAQNAKALTAIVGFIRYQVNGTGTISLDDIAAFMAKEEVVVQRKGKDTIKQVNIRGFVRAVEMQQAEDGQFSLLMEIMTTPSGTGKPEEVVRALSATAGITACIRVAQCCEIGGRILSPIEVRQV